ncbi:unnamed protein product [Orchesella dallaii]|uniref:Uncharacterized protein n=1 Tax=Orchesella dallaii TaxID=48710 RepID=A0ABP1R420_9HEXA
MDMDSQQNHQSLELDEDMQEFNCESPIRPSTPSPVISPIALRVYVPDSPVLKHQKLVPDTPVATKFKHILGVSSDSRQKTNILREYKDEHFWKYCDISDGMLAYNLYTPSTGTGNTKRAVAKKENPVRKGLLTQYQPSYITCEAHNLAEYLSLCLIPLGERLNHEKPLTNLGKNAVWADTTLEQFYDNGDNVYRFDKEKITAKGCTIFKNSDEIEVKIFQLADTMKSIHEASVLLEEHKIAKKRWDKERREFARTNKDPEAKCPPEPMKPHVGYTFTLNFLEYFRYIRDTEQMKLIYIHGLNKHD